MGGRWPDVQARPLGNSKSTRPVTGLDELPQARSGALVHHIVANPMLNGEVTSTRTRSHSLRGVRPFISVRRCASTCWGGVPGSSSVPA